MLKISQAGSPNQSITLKLEGRVVGPWVEELRRICEPLLIQQRELNLDLADVSYLDNDGVATLIGFRSRGVKLDNCSAFLEQQMKVPC
jgi:ABC-type transporter Mla MlaB component